MFAILCTLSASVSLAAAPPRAAYLQVRDAVQRDILRDFDGTVSFQRESWVVAPYQTADAERGVKYRLTDWTIQKSADGAMSARASFPANPEAPPWIIGRNRSYIWQVVGGELYVYDRWSPKLTEDTTSAFGHLNSFLTATDAHVDRIFGSETLPAGPIRVDRQALGDPQPSASFIIGENTFAANFASFDGGLQLKSLRYARDGNTYTRTYDDYRSKEGLVFPGTFELVQDTGRGVPERFVYSNIDVARAKNPNEFAVRISPPLPGQPGYEQVRQYFFVSSEGLSSNGFSGSVPWADTAGQ